MFSNFETMKKSSFCSPFENHPVFNASIKKNRSEDYFSRLLKKLFFIANI